MSLDILIENTPITLHDRYLVIGDALVLADVHLGKTTHFRKSGIAMPSAARTADQDRLLHVLNTHRPRRLIVLGDLFHSRTNSELEELQMIVSQYPDTSFELVIGNHDILDPADYRTIDFECVDRMTLGDFVLTHEPLEDREVGKNQRNLHAHIHPGVVLRGKGRQSVCVPCFHFGARYACMPAFGALTGLKRQTPVAGDRIFAVAAQRIFEVT